MLPVAVTGAVSFASKATSFFGSSDPAKDAERQARIDSTFALAVAGSTQAADCLNDMANRVFGGTRCAVGSDWAVKYAQSRWTEFQGLVTAGQVTGPVVATAKAAAPWAGLVAVVALVFVLPKLLRR